MEKAEANTAEKNPRLGTVGGQAVLEGVMMKSGNRVSVTVRRPDGGLSTRNKVHAPLREKHKILGIPVIRGVVNFVEMLSLAMSTLTESAEMLEAGTGETPDAAGKKGGSTATAAATAIGAVLGLALSVGLFMFLPAFISKSITNYFDIAWFTSLISGVIKLAIFLAYISLVGLLPDIRRTFQYHGAEHMSVFCYEKGDDLTVENVRKCSRFHPRCGTSFMIAMILLGVIVTMPSNALLRFPFNFFVNLSIFPLIVGIGFEFIRFAGRSDNAVIRALAAPGMWVQRITTKNPDDAMLEVAIKSLNCAVGNVGADDPVGPDIPAETTISSDE